MAGLEGAVSRGGAACIAEAGKKVCTQSSSGNELIDVDEKWFQSIVSATRDQTQKPPRIWRARQVLHDTKDFEKYYEPRVVSIGPYHHESPKLRPMQKVKLKIANKFVSNDGQLHGRQLVQRLKDLYEQLFEMIKEVRACYDEDSTARYIDEDLVQMMLVDGCFILYYIQCSIIDNGNVSSINDFEMKSHHVAFVLQDLFLLENQIPFRVLEVLMRMRFKDMNEGMNRIDQFLRKNLQVEPNKNKRKKSQEMDGGKVPYAHLLEVLREGMVGEGDINICQGDSPCTFRNVQELIAAGIYFKKSKKTCFSDISFSSYKIYAHLKLPRITVDDSSKGRFLNLVAYEMCPDTPDDFGVTSYLCFLDSLIDQAEDVKELRSAEILHNYLGSDKEVAKLFNEIGKDLVPHPCAYAVIKEQIQKHYKKKGKTWMAQFFHNHFSSPWTILAFFGAIVALVLTALQTFHQILNQSECDKYCRKFI